jgi:diketogulonate reductase-like aldo/keto reductase
MEVSTTAAFLDLNDGRKIPLGKECKDAVTAALDIGSAFIELNDGRKMPLFGLGTFKLKGQECTDAVTAALDIGYKLIDTATIYRNEQDIGAALRAPGAPAREQVFITSKISPKQMGNPLEAIEESLQKLGVGYLDLCLLHWPGTGGMKPDDPRQPEKRLQSWQALQTAQKNGWCRSIGVSNFQARHIKHLCASPETTVVPAVNQFELHPHFPQLELVALCRQRGIAVQAYSSLGQGGALLQDPVVVRIAAAHACSEAQVCLRWALQKGYAVIPRSTRRERIETNARATDGAILSLSQEEMDQLDALHTSENKREKLCWDPETVA